MLSRDGTGTERLSGAEGGREGGSAAEGAPPGGGGSGSLSPHSWESLLGKVTQRSC